MIVQNKRKLIEFYIQIFPLMSKERSFQNQFKGLMLYRCRNCKLLVISQTTDLIILPRAHLHFHFHRWRVVLEYPGRPVDICSNHEDFQNFFR